MKQLASIENHTDREAHELGNEELTPGWRSNLPVTPEITVQEGGLIGPPKVTVEPYPASEIAIETGTPQLTNCSTNCSS